MYSGWKLNTQWEALLQLHGGLQNFPSPETKASFLKEHFVCCAEVEPLG